MTAIINIASHQIGSGSGLQPALYAVPNASMEVLEAIINATWDLGLTKSSTATGKAGALQTLIDNIIASPGSYHVSAGTVTVPTITAPGVTIPTSVNPSAIYSEFSTQYLALATWLDGKFTSFRSTYFPNEAALYAAAESSLSDALTNDNYIPASVQTRIVGDAFAQITADKQRAQAALDHMYAGKRFPLPPDVLASAQMQLEQKAQDQMAETSRKIVVMSIDQYKFVIEKCINLRTIALHEATEYVRALASGPELASRLVNLGYDAQQKLISAAADFYRADTGAKEVVAKVNEYNNSTALEVLTKNQMADLTLLDDKVKALIADLDTTVREATALFNNLHTQVSMTAGGTTVGTTP